MYEQQQQTSGLFQTVSGLAAALGLAAAIFATPLAFACTRAPIAAYLARQFGEAYAMPLTWLLGGIEAYLIYGSCRMVITFAVTWLLTVLAGRGLGV